MLAKIRMAAVIFCLSNAAFAGQPTVVPAYFIIAHKTDSHKADTDWTRIANEPSGSVLAVVPDGSFTGGGLAGSCNSGDQDYCGACSPPCTGAFGLCAAKCQFVVNHNAGQLVLGYQNGDFACHLRQSLSAAEVNQAIDNGWFHDYPTQVQGVFVDDGPTIVSGSSCATPEAETPDPNQPALPSQQDDYSTVYSHVNGAGGVVMLNASQFEHEWIMSGTYKSADYAVTFEKAYNIWYDSTTYKAEDGTVPDWWKTGYPGKLAHIIWNATQYDISDGVSHTQGTPYNSPVLYFFDGTPDSYGHLSCSFETQVALLQGTTPVPSATTYCGSDCTDLSTDASNCGACNTACTTGVPAAAQAASTSRPT